MKRIGIVSENYATDGKAIRNLLEKKWNDKRRYVFLPVLKSLSGKQLRNTEKVKRLLQTQVKIEKLDFLIFAHDLDGLPSETEKVNDLQIWFKKIAVNNAEDLLLIVIYELEALILGDIDTFNRMYKCKISFSKNPLYIEEPKEFLENFTKKNKRPYKESDAPEIFAQLNFDIVYANHYHPDHPCFQSFIDELDQKIA